MNLTKEKVEEMLKLQAKVTAQEVAVFCAAVCDANRGLLSVGDKIRERFKIEGSNEPSTQLTIVKTTPKKTSETKTTLTSIKGNRAADSKAEKSRAKLTVIK